ncbi:hypothetical protein [Undibacterium flavidum]|uniref:Uncharacterized protein n=1 Tax=Undibacterium flavidum TaxID=2762297 RepID=A0ABR6YAE2_9BURK|nr:hypothetical protein [Undibacterium flavidum]MBC3873596.1 hypothetical protein [Undibacterium flavidum]
MRNFFAFPPGYSQMRLWIYAVFSAFFACLTAPWLGTDAGIQDPSNLAFATGQVTWIGNHKYGVKFKFSEDPRTFDYPSKAGKSGMVLTALSGASKQSVTVRFNPQAHRSLLGDGEVFDAWEIKVGDKLIRSWAEAADEWKSDHSLRPWLAFMFALIGTYFAAHAWFRRRSDALERS